MREEGEREGEGEGRGGWGKAKQIHRLKCKQFDGEPSMRTLLNINHLY